MPIDVSVIITSYNIASYIERALASALAQEGVAVEVIIVDDCSTDATWQVISAITDPRVHAFRLEKNSGPSIARNYGIAQAKGAWLAVLDGDDQFASGRLARCVALAQQQQADVVVDNLSVVREVDGQSFPMFDAARLAAKKQLTPEKFIAGNHSFVGGYGFGYMKPIFSAPFLKQHRLAYHEDIRIGEDYVLMLEVLASGARCVIDPTEGYHYTVRAGSISHRLTKEDVERIQAQDDRIFAKYTMSAQALACQRVRSKNLVEAYAFNNLVEEIKAGNWREALRVVRDCPRSALHLWQPVWVRLRRLATLLRR